MTARKLCGDQRALAWRATAWVLACAASTALHAADSVTRGDLQWSLRTNGEYLPWPTAERHCADLTQDGHADWRLPTLPELEALHDPDAPDGQGIVAPIALDTCCLWSQTTLIDLPADGDSPTGGDPADYRWGFLFDSGIRYYSHGSISDGRALCVRDVD